MPETFSYPNSQHADQKPAQPASPPAAAPEPKAASGPMAFSYPETNKPEPMGAAQDDVPEAVRELRASDEARRLHSPQKTYAEVIPVGDETWPEENKAAAAEWREIMGDWEIPVNDARELVGVFQGLTEIPSDDKVGAWEREAEAELRRAYGGDTAQALADARALVARDPRVQLFLNGTGLGSHPKFVMHAARIARSQRGRGRLK